MLYRFALATLLVTAGCSKDNPPSGAPTGGVAAAAPARSKDPAGAKQLIAAGATVLDVRTAEEFAEDHLAQARNIPVQELGGRLAEVDKLVGGDRTKPIVVYCRSGNRSRQAKAQLEAAGFTQVVNGGGLDDVR